MSVDKIAKLIKKGDTQKIAQLLQDPSLDINALQPKSGKTLAQLAIQSQQSQIFSMLLHTKGLRLDTTSKSGDTALDTAILMNSPQFVDQILRTKINHKPKNQNHSAMYTAIKNKTSPQIIKKLINAQFDVNQNIAGYGSLLNLAIACDQFQNFMILLQNPKIDLKLEDDQANTCLLLSTKEKRGQFVQAILKKLGNVENKTMTDMDKQFFINSCDRNGDTALHIAAKKDYQTIADILVREGTPLGLDKQIKNKQGKTYLNIIQQRTQARQKQRQNQEYQQKKKIQQKRIKQKQKQQERQRLLKQQEMLKASQKKRKKQQQILQAQKREMTIKMQKNRKLWIVGIAVIVIVGVTYLLFLSAVPNRSKPDF